MTEEFIDYRGLLLQDKNIGSQFVKQDIKIMYD